MSTTSGAFAPVPCDLIAATSSAEEPFGFCDVILIFGYFFSKPAMILP